MSIQFTLDGIGHLIADRTLQVPVYQRSYAWDREQVVDYWSDLRRALDESFAEYFMGTIVAARANGESIVIDGQQRLATTTIFLAALRDAYAARKDDNRARAIHDQYLARFDLESAQSRPRLALNVEDRDFFQSQVIDGSGGDTEIPSHRRMLDAQNRLRGWLEEDLASRGDEWPNRMLSWVTLIHNTVKVMVVDVPDVADGFVIFETLNDRGAPLTISDLLRNYLMSRGEDDAGIAAVQMAWGDALLNLGLLSEDDVFVDFLRQFWSSHRGAVREKELFEAIRVHTPDRHSTLDFASRLPGGSFNYAALLDSHHELWREYRPEVRWSIEALLRLDLKQYRPLALALLDVFDKEELARTFQALVSWTVRGLIVGGIGGGVAERAYGVAATKVRSGELLTAGNLLRQLIPIVPNDTDFRANFARARVPRLAVARYLMTALEREARQRSAPELVDEDFGEGLRLQYVMPKGASPQSWPTLDEEELKALVPRLGNAILLSDADAALPPAGDFAARKQIIVSSSVQLTRTIARYESWGVEEIDERQQELAERAIRTWPRGLDDANS